MNVIDDNDVLLCAEHYRILRQVMNRLYDDRPLSGDQRRDLANTMFAVLQSLPELDG
jgi:hypothetical protein